MGVRQAQGRLTGVHKRKEQRCTFSQLTVKQEAGLSPSWGDKVPQSKHPQGPGRGWLQVIRKTLRWYLTALGGTVPLLYIFFSEGLI